MTALRSLIASVAVAMAASDAAATHVSKPVITTQKVVYKAGETLSVRGWAEYQDKPAAGVLLDIRLGSPSGGELLRKSVRSDAAGNFSLDYQLPAAAAPGDYALEVISQCNDAHRSICTHQKSSMRLKVNPGGAK
jgi:uncharacterized protein YfaS (alpha-2-macroglobulin family)